MTKVALDHIEVAVHQNDSSSVPNTKQPESSWHRVSAATCQLLLVTESGLFEDGNLSASYKVANPYNLISVYRLRISASPIYRYVSEVIDAIDRCHLSPGMLIIVDSTAALMP